MKRQFHINLPGRDAIIINLNDKEHVSVRVESPPRAFEPDASTTCKIDGNRWSGDDFFMLEWAGGELALNNTLTIQLVEDDRTASALQKEELFVRPELACRFCQKTQSQVRYLIDRNVFAQICDDCVAMCQQLIEKKKRRFRLFSCFSALCHAVRQKEKPAQKRDNLIMWGKQAKSLRKKSRR